MFFRPGVLKDLKTMGSVSLFIFFITLLVLARQVSGSPPMEISLVIKLDFSATAAVITT